MSLDMEETAAYHDVPPALREKFRASLPERLDIIQTAWKAISEGTPSEFATLRLHVHRLAGATGTYGYARLHATSCRLEAAIDAGQSLDAMEPLYLELRIAIESL